MKNDKVSPADFAASRSRVFELATVLVLIGLLWLLIGLFIQDEFRRESREALNTTAQFALALDAQITGRIDTIDARARFAQSVYEADPEHFRFGDWAGLGSGGDIVAAYLIDKDGFARLNEAGPLPVALDRRDRAYFQTHMADPSDDRLMIGMPITGRVANHQVITFSRALHDRSGAFRAIVLFSVDTDSFSRLYRSIRLTDGTITLFGLDGIVRARGPGNADDIGTAAPAATMAFFRVGGTQMSRRTSETMDGADSFVTVRRIAAYPLVVAVSIHAGPALSAAYDTRVKAFAAGALVTALISGLWLAMTRMRLTDARGRAALVATVEHMGQGVALFDAAGRIAAVNRAAIDLLGLPSGLSVPGARVADVLAWQEQFGEFRGTGVPAANRAALLMPPGTPVVLAERTRPDGTILEIRTEALPDGSHLRSWRDITEARRAERAVAAARDQALRAEAILAAALENVPHGVLVVGDNEKVEFVNERAIDLIGLPRDVLYPGSDWIAVRQAQLSLGHLDATPELAEQVRRNIASHTSGRNTYERHTAGGRVMEVRTTALDARRFVRTYTDITARHEALRAQQAARDEAVAARAALAVAFEEVPHGVLVIGADNRIQIFNERARDLLGIPASVLYAGADWRDARRWQLDNGMFDASPGLAEGMRQSLESGLIARLPYERPTAGGRMLEVRTTALGDGRMVRTYTDVTARHEAQREQKAARDALTAALESAPHGVVLIGADNRVQIVNENVLDLLGLSTDILHPGSDIAVAIKAIADRGDLDEIPEIAAQTQLSLTDRGVYKTAPVRMDQYLRKTHDGRILDVRTTVLDDNRVIRTYTDVTAQHEVLRARERARDEALAAQAALAAALKHVPHGVMLIGADKIVQVVNDEAISLLALPDGVVRPGVPVAEILRMQDALGDLDSLPRFRDSNGDISESPQSPANLPGFSRRHERPTRDGRVVEVRRTVLDDGRVIRTYTDVTDRKMALTVQKEARDRAEAAEALLAGALQAVPHGLMVIGRDNKLQLINDIAAGILRLPPELTNPGADALDIMRFQIARGDLTDIAPIADRIVGFLTARAGHEDPPLHLKPFERRTADGRMVEVRSTLLPDGRLIRSFTDVTERHAALLAQQEARQRAEAAEAALSAALEHVAHGVILVDADRIVQVINSAAIDILGVPPEHAKPGVHVGEGSRYYRDRAAREDDPDLAERIRTSLAAPVLVSEPFERHARDGRTIDVRTAVLDGGRVVRTYTDITAQKAALQAQQESRMAAEAAVRARTEFLGVVSHELRTPLNAVIGFSGLLLSQDLNRQDKDDVRMIEAAGQQLLGLVDDILTVSQLERGKVSLRELAFDPCQVIRSTAALIAERARSKGLAFTVELDDSLPAAAYGDSDRLRQVLLKVLDNAVKFTTSGGVALTAGLTASDAAGYRVRVTVADTGIGIRPEVLPHLCDPFVQADSSTTRRFGGTGLGLAVCRLLLEAMDGTISAENQPGGGAMFRIEIGLRRMVDDIGADGLPLRVLVADDNGTNRAVLLSLVKRLGHRGDGVEDGTAAVAAVMARQYDLVLMDVMMPVMDGIQATRAIRALPGAAGRIPILGVSVDISDHTGRACLEAGMNGFETRPPNRDRLRAAIEAVTDPRS